ncbi:UDP-glucose 4-epimerase [Acidihalobacter prosperus]|uniref:UDP-glucose 4-epimerase n=2 Tax=Acidihalobacter prosperus TaxID=160660 RepID=A0A1A6C603_9GAMM|nr:UDP-glucose 4-epimerase [Acidihalobacter prosperus]
MVAALKDRGYRVVGLGQDDCGADVSLSCDLTDAEAVRRAIAEAQPTHVVHLAGIAFVGHGSAEDFYRVHVFGTLNLLSALETLAQPPRVLIAGSANVYGTPDVEVLDESICPAPVNHYATSKLAMEHMVRTRFERMPIVIARPFNYTGIGQSEDFLIPKIVSHFKRGAETIELGNLDVSRDFSDVRDTVDAYVALLESDVRSQVVNVCSGRAVALRAVLAEVGRLAGYEIKVRVNPAFVRANEIPVLRGSRDKLVSLVDCAIPRPLSDTLAWMYQE